MQALKLNEEQENNKILPIFDFEVTGEEDSIPFLKLRPYTNDIKIQKARAYFPDLPFENFVNNWQVVQPDFGLPLFQVHGFLSNYLYKTLNFDSTDNVHEMTFDLDNEVPLGMTIEYIQYGKVKTVYGQFSIQYRYTIEEGEKPHVKFNGAIFKQYLPDLKTLEKSLYDSASKLFNKSLKMGI